jgi:hypothetical protein
MVENIAWLGHDSFRIEGSQTVYVDPWKTAAGAPPADVILITHDHFDHLSKDDIARLRSGHRRRGAEGHFAGGGRDAPRSRRGQRRRGLKYGRAGLQRKQFRGPGGVPSRPTARSATSWARRRAGLPAGDRRDPR